MYFRRYGIAVALSVGAGLWIGCASLRAPTPSAASTDPGTSRALRVAVLEYESALEAQDLGRLQRVWSLTPEQRTELVKLFDGVPIDVQIQWRSVTVGDHLAIVDFDQVLRHGSQTGPQTPLTAALTPDSNGGWRIAFLGEREEATPEPAPAEPATSVASAPAEPAVGPLSWSDPGQRKSVTRLRADLVQRAGGEWVIVSLAPDDGKSAPLAGGRPATGAVADGLRAALKRYTVAFEERDADRLGQVWLMNPYERDVVDQLFAWTSMVAVSIDGLTMQVDGGRARMAFDQEFVMSSRPRVASLARRAFERALAASDAAGAWDLDSLTP